MKKLPIKTSDFYSKIKKIIRDTIKSLLLFFLVVCINFTPAIALATDIEISTTISAAQLYSVDGQSIAVVSGGNLTVNTATTAAVHGDFNTSLILSVNSGDIAKGIIASGSHGALEITGTASASTITLGDGSGGGSGLITSDTTSGATILLSGAGGTTNLTTSSGTTISNTATPGYAINSDTTSNTTLTITNAGTISTTNNASSIAINFGDSDGGSALTIANTGLITAGSSGTAIKINNSSNTASISNTGSGSITGAISVGANNTTLTNNTSGTIAGNIFSTTGNLAITNTAGNITGNIYTNSSSGGDLDLTLSAGTITGDVTLGDNSSSSITLNGGTISGNIIMNQANQQITFNGGALSGTLNGAGKAVISANTTLGGHIGGTTSLTSVTVSAGTLSNSSNNIAATNILISSGATLALSGGTITTTGGSLRGSSDGVGTVNLTATRTLETNLGTSGAKLAVISLNDSVTLTSNAYNLYATTIKLGTSSILNIGATSVIGGDIDGTSSATGTVNITADNTLANAIGSSNGIVALNIANGATLTANGSINATSVTVGSGSAAALTLATAKTLTGNLTLAANATTTLSGSAAVTGNVTLGTSSTLTANSGAITGTVTLGSLSTLSLGSGGVTSTILGSSDGVGAVTFNNSLSLAAAVGSIDNSLLTVTIAGGTLSNSSNNIAATNILISSGATLALSGGTITTTGGSLRGSSDGVGTVNLTATRTLETNLGTSGAKLAVISLNDSVTLTSNAYNLYATTIKLGTSSILNIGATSVIGGDIDGTSSATGTVNITADNTLANAIGSSNGIVALNIANGATLTANGSINATSVTVGSGSAAALTLATAKTLTGNLTLAANATTTLSGSAAVTGNVTLGTSSTLTANSGAITGTVTLGSLSTLSLGSGGVTSTILGSSDGVGAVTFNNSLSLAANVGDSTHSLASITVANNKTLTTGINNIDATVINLGSSSTLALSTGTVVGNVLGTGDGVGNITLANNFTMAGNFGSTSNSLDTVTLADGKTLTVGNYLIDANTIVMGANSALTVSGSGSINAAISYGVNNATVTNNASSTISGTISATSGHVDVTNTAGTISGNISTTSGELDVVVTAGTVSGNISTTSGDADVVLNGGTASGTVNLGSNASSTVIINSGATESGTITTGNTNQTVTFNGGNLTADLLGNGKAVIAANTTLGGNVGSITASLTSVTINDSKTLTAGTKDIKAAEVFVGDNSTLALASGSVTGDIKASSDNQGAVTFAGNFTLNGALGTSTNSIRSATVADSTTLTVGTKTVDVTNLYLGSNSTLALSGTAVNGDIKGTSDGVGNVTVSDNLTLNNNLGSSDKSLAAVTVASNKTLAVGSNNIDATTVTLASGSVMQLASGTVTGNIAGSSSGIGTVTFTATQTTAGTIGQSTSVGTVVVNNSATVTLGDDVTASTITVGSGASGQLNTNAKNITATDVNLNSGATLNVNVASTISGAINGTSSGVGTLQLSGSGSITQASAIGSTAKLAQVLISDNTTYNTNANINADTIIIGNGTSGTLNLSAGTFGASSSTIKIDNGAKLSYAGGTINGTIKGESASDGTFEVAANYTNTTKLGAINSLAVVSILADKTLTTGADIAASTVNVAGTMDLGSTARTVSGNVTTSGAGIINLNNAAHVVTGSLALNSGNTLQLSVTSATNAGSITTSGVTTNSSGSIIALDVATNIEYIPNGTKYVIVAGGSGSSLATLASSNINVNNSGSNKFNRIIFNTSVENNELILDVTRLAASSVVSNGNAQTIYDNFNQLTSTSGTLRELQNYIENTNISIAQVEEVLKSTTPQVDNSTNRNAVTVVTASLGAAEARLDSSHEIGVASGDEIENRGIWAKILDSSARQSAVRSGGDGYESKAHGFTIGGDGMFCDTLLGFNTSYVSSEIKASSGTKSTNVESYQFNFYRGDNFGKIFLDTMLGFAWNEYSSNRIISATSNTAKANYNGQTYVAKARAGIVNKLKNELKIIPSLTVTTAHNRVATYTEDGAGTLNLTTQNDSTNFFETRLGLNFEYDFVTKDKTKITPHLQISYGHDFVGAKQSTTSNFIGQSSSFSMSGSKVYNNSIIASSGIDLYRGDSVQLGAEYTFENKHNYQAHTGLIKARYNF